MSVKDPCLGFEFLFTSKVISYVLPEISSLGDHERKELISQVVGVDPNPFLRFAVFKEKIPNNIDEYSRLNLTKKLAIILSEI